MSRLSSRALREMREYLESYPDATSEEKSLLLEWMKDGNSPYENGNYLCDEAGYLMDFIADLRFWEDLRLEFEADPEGFMKRYCSDSCPDSEDSTTDLSLLL